MQMHDIYTNRYVLWLLMCMHIYGYITNMYVPAIYS